MKFRKPISFFLALLLLLTNTGLAFRVHFCGGEVAAVQSEFHQGSACKMEQRMAAEKPCCAKKLALEHNKCCKDKKLDFKSKTDLGLSKQFSFQPDVVFLPSQTPGIPFLHCSKNTTPRPERLRYYCEAHSPPLFKLYSQYRLYA